MKKTAIKKLNILLCMILLAVFSAVATGCDLYTTAEQAEDEQQTESEEQAGDEGQAGQAASDINLRDVDGGGWNYRFTYKGEDYTAIYYYDNWCVYDSYKITSGRAMKKICQALIDEHPVHGSDYESFRTAKDMVYEWKQHNIAYAVLPDDNPWKTTTGNVDFDPEDQGKSVSELYESRTGEKFDFLDHKDDIKEYLKDLLQ